MWLMENVLGRLQKNDNWVRFFCRKERPSRRADGRRSRDRGRHPRPQRTGDGTRAACPTIGNLPRGKWLAGSVF